MTRKRNPARDYMYHCIFTTALEGGIGYWSVCEEYHWQGSDGDFGDCDFAGFRAVVIDIEDYEDNEEAATRLVIDRKAIVKGFRAIADGKYTNLRKDIIQSVVWADRNPDDFDIDADVADIIVQLGVLGDVIYG